MPSFSEIIRKFLNRYKTLSGNNEQHQNLYRKDQHRIQYPQRQKVDERFLAHSEQFIKLQIAWRKKRASSKLVPINVNGNHNSEFIDVTGSLINRTRAILAFTLNGLPFDDSDFIRCFPQYFGDNGAFRYTTLTSKRVWVLTLKKAHPGKSDAELREFWETFYNHVKRFVGESEGLFSCSLEHQYVAKVERSTDQEKLSRLKLALDEGRWDDPIFEDNHIHHIALGLFDDSQITRQQFSTILESLAAISDFGPVIFYPILRKNGELTTEARAWLIPALQKTNHLRELSEEKISEFCKLVAQFPRSEQFFYMGGNSTKFPLFERLKIVDSVYQHGGELVHLSHGAKYALGIARFGLKQVSPTLSRIGILSIDTMEQSISQHARYAYVGFPGVKRPTTIHEYRPVSETGTTAHDYYHSLIHATIPLDIHRALDHMISIIREAFGTHWSSDIWELVDRELKFLFTEFKVLYPDKWSPEELAQKFCHLLNRHDIKERFIHKHRLTDIGITVFLDMVRNEALWREMRINPAALDGDFGKHFQILKELEVYFDDCAKNNILKYHIYLALEDKKKFPAWCKLVNEADPQVLKAICFMRDNRVNFLGLKAKQIPGMTAAQPLLDIIHFVMLKLIENKDIQNTSINLSAFTNTLWSTIVRTKNRAGIQYLIDINSSALSSALWSAVVSTNKRADMEYLLTNGFDANAQVKEYIINKCKGGGWDVRFTWGWGGESITIDDKEYIVALPEFPWCH